MTSDIFSHGSGLAVSSSYSCGLVHAVEEMLKTNHTDIECGIKAHNLEKLVNPRLGLQDVFGCCVGGFKKIEFEKEKLPKYTFYPTKLFDVYNACLIFTGYTRSSTEVLKGVTVPDIDKFNSLVEEGEQYLLKEDFSSFMKIMNAGWNEKKLTSTTVLSNPYIKELDNKISKMKGCVSHKLCGAGNGGFFLCFFEKDVELPKNGFMLQLTNSGVKRVL